MSEQAISVIYLVLGLGLILPWDRWIGEWKGYQRMRKGGRRG